MIKPHGVMAVLLAAVLALSGCSSRDSITVPESPSSDSSGSAAPSTESPGAGNPDSQADTATPNQENHDDYIDSLVQQTVAKILQPGMSEFDKTKAAFDYMIANTNLVDPIGLDLWRIRGDYGQPPSFVENRALSVLLFQVGMCEDYAAALTLLLRGMGLEAEYVPGLTYSSQGYLVDHAWTQVKVDGVWYHLDCQLEQNISRHGSIRYKYFLCSDATMADSHRWGQNLIDSRLLTDRQNEEIAGGYLMQTCPQNYETPGRQDFTKVELPDVDALIGEIEAEFQAYEETHGPLEPLELNINPPVFGVEGYGPTE